MVRAGRGAAVEVGVRPDALVWYVTRDARYAAAAIRIMDAWSATIKTHTTGGTPADR